MRNGLKPGRCGTMTHDNKHHGTTTLFAARNVLEGTVIGRCMQAAGSSRAAKRRRAGGIS
jgi:hypothetical protein